MQFRARLLAGGFIFLWGISAPLWGQIPEDIFKDLAPRAVGPAVMGGRTVDFAVYEKDPGIFYAASASGGLLKTVNGGATWENVFDRQGTVSIGDVAINRADPNVVWVGTGEANSRQSSSWGDGIYKSTDGGKSWKHMGLRESHHIGRIVINPIDTDIVYVAALGHLWGANPERGVFMTTDGGVTWQHVLSIDSNTGVVDIAMDLENPKILYAGAYARQRSSFGFNGGGPNGGVFKTVDGGRSWRKLTEGLPEGNTGRIGLDIYRQNSNIVYAIIQNENGGVFRSEDKGESWMRMSDLNPRPMYYSQIRIDPNDDNRIYVLGTNLHVSDDAGKTFRDDGSEGVHLDHHAFWIDPGNSRHLIDGNDGGIWVSRDRSDHWEHLNNYPIGQFYHVAVDMQDPYWIYGGMQDNASWAGPSAVRARIGIRNDDWIQMLACDGMYTVLDPSDGKTVYTNCQGGRIVRWDRNTGERKAVMPGLDSDPDFESEDERLRWNWTTPIVASTHDAETLYTGGNQLFKSTNRGQSWTVISEDDLTTQTDRDELMLMGVALKDATLSRNDGTSSYGNITALAESPLKEGLLYVGTDDGKIHVTRDGGGAWRDLTDRIPGVPKMLYVSRLTPSAFDEGTVYATFDGHRSDNFEPYALVSTDYGESWRSIASNLPTGSVYTIKEDTKNRDLLYLGTEFGLFVSLNRGGNWTRWSTVPTVAVFDLVLQPRENDLILGTHGRSFLVIDDITPVQQLNSMVLAADGHLFDIRPATEFIPNENAWFIGGREFTGPNPTFGAYINYHLKADLKEDDALTITVKDSGGKAIRELSGPKSAGLHRVAWDLRTPPVGDMEPGFYGNLDFSNSGPLVVPGTYQVTLSAAGQQQTKSVLVKADPFVPMSDADRRKVFDAQFLATEMQSTAQDAGEVLNQANRAIGEIEELLKDHSNAPEAVKKAVESSKKEVTDLRTRLVGAGRRGGGFGGPQPLQRRISSLKGELIGSQTLPTALQASRLQQYLTDLNALLPEVNKVRESTLPGLYKVLADNKIWPTAGEAVKPVVPR